MKFGSKKAIFGAIWGGFEGFGPCLGNSHPTHPHLGKISPKKNGSFFGSFPKWIERSDLGMVWVVVSEIEKKRGGQ